MVISKLALRNWKNFKSLEIDFKDRVFIVGANATGKSNLLDVFRFLRDIAKPGGGLQKAVLDRGGISKIRSLGARKYPDVEIEISLSEYGSEKIEWRYAIGIKQQARGNRLPYLSYERVWKGEALILNRPDKEDDKDELRSTQTYLEQINTNKNFRDVAKFFESILYLHLVPQLLKYPQAFTGPDLPGDPFGKGFPSCSEFATPNIPKVAFPCKNPYKGTGVRQPRLAFTSSNSPVIVQLAPVVLQ